MCRPRRGSGLNLRGVGVLHGMEIVPAQAIRLPRGLC